MTYAIELVLGRKDQRTLRITDPYSIHRVVYSLFDDVRSTEDYQCKSSGFLYADLGNDLRGRRLLILSNREPREFDLQDGLKTVKTVPEAFLKCDFYRFKTTLNPSRRNNITRKRESIVGEENILQWFTQKTEQWGFVVVGTATVENSTVQRFKGKNNCLVTVNMATLTGVLRVTDRDLFKKAFESGLGKERAFGCGLLQLVPVS